MCGAIDVPLDRDVMCRFLASPVVGGGGGGERVSQKILEKRSLSEKPISSSAKQGNKHY